MNPTNVDTSFSRRHFLRIASGILGASVLVGSACRANAPTAPTPGPAGSNVAPGQPTAAPPKLAATTTSVGQAASNGLMRPGDGTPKRGGTLRIAAGTATAPHFDLHQGAPSAVLSHAYNNLVRKDLTDGLRTIIPDLAQRWEMAPDGQMYTFFLRDGVKFHDGGGFGAEDVVATFNRILSPPSGVASVLRSQLDMVDKVEMVDRLTVRFTLKHPALPFLETLTQPAMVVYAKKSIDETNGDLRKAVAPGTGAFMFKDQKAGEKWTFARNPGYWDSELPYVETLELLDTPQLTDRGTAVLTGRADMAWNSSVDTWREGQERADAFAVAQIPNFGAHTAHLNNTRGPLADKRVRRAIHLAVSRQNIYKAYQGQEPIFLGRWMCYASPASPPLAEIEKLPGYRADKSADIAEAKRLMADAGYANGFGPVELVSATAPWAAEIMAPTFADELKRTLNIATTIRLVERGLLIEEYKKGSFDILVETQFASPIADFTPAWNQYLRCGGSQNWSRYCNADFDALLDRLNVEGDAAKQKAIFGEGMDMLDQEAPFFVTGFTAHSAMWRKGLKGLALDKRVYSEWGRVETAWLEHA